MEAKLKRTACRVYGQNPAKASRRQNRERALAHAVLRKLLCGREWEDRTSLPEREKKTGGAAGTVRRVHDPTKARHAYLSETGMLGKETTDWPYHKSGAYIPPNEEQTQTSRRSFQQTCALA